MLIVSIAILLFVAIVVQSAEEEPQDETNVDSTRVSFDEETVEAETPVKTKQKKHQKQFDGASDEQGKTKKNKNKEYKSPKVPKESKYASNSESYEEKQATCVCKFKV